ncbi:ROK family protein [Streptomyces anandii]|uniref:ROK family protein n=1 Tax=Streptomyces anandii TaxID=285454 RepID=UPI0036FDCB06
MAADRSAVSSGLVIACDVGGTGIKAGLVDARARVRHTLTVPTPVVPGDGAATATAVMDCLVRLTEDLRAAAEAQSVSAVALGVVVPGLVDPVAGIARYSENLGWRDVPFLERLAAATGLPVGFDHDVRAAGTAEQRLGAGRGRRDVMFMPIGTGIAAALVLDGHAYAGEGWAGEIGHIDVGSGLPCVCGGSGCLETVASAAAIGRRYAERTGRPARGAAEVVERLTAGDEDAAAVWSEAVEALSTVLAATAGLIAPEVVLVGGGLSRAGEALLGPLRRRLDARLTLQRRPQLRIAELGERAGLLGAGLLAWERVGVALGPENGPVPATPAEVPSSRTTCPTDSMSARM